MGTPFYYNPTTISTTSSNVNLKNYVTNTQLNTALINKIGATGTGTFTNLQAPNVSLGSPTGAIIFSSNDNSASTGMYLGPNQLYFSDNGTIQSKNGNHRSIFNRNSN